MTKSDIGTVPQHAKRAKAEGIPVSEYTIRRLIKQGIIPARYIGPKSVFSYAALMRYLSCEDGSDNAQATRAGSAAIRRIDREVHG